MIRKVEDLKSALQAGRICAIQGLWEVPGFRLAMTDTGETVHRSALRILIEKGGAVKTQRDLVGDAVSWAAPMCASTSETQPAKSA